MCFESWDDGVFDGHGVDWIFYNWLHEGYVGGCGKDKDGFQHFLFFVHHTNKLLATSTTSLCLDCVHNV